VHLPGYTPVESGRVNHDGKVGLAFIIFGVAERPTGEAHADQRMTKVRDEQ
jgi:hypothetical protein